MRAACASCGSGGSGFAAARVTGPFCFERKQLVAGQCVFFAARGGERRAVSGVFGCREG